MASNVSQPRGLEPIVEKDVKIPMRDGVGASACRHYHADYSICAQNMLHAGGDATSRLLLPIVAAKAK